MPFKIFRLFLYYFSEQTFFYSHTLHPQYNENVCQRKRNKYDSFSCGFFQYERSYKTCFIYNQNNCFDSFEAHSNGTFLSFISIFITVHFKCVAYSFKLLNCLFAWPKFSISIYFYSFRVYLKNKSQQKRFSNDKSYLICIE